MPKKKQTKADKEFVAKIATIGINTGGKKETKTCPDCGHDMEQIGMLVGEVHGKKMAGPVYGHRKPKTERADEQSFSA